MQDHCRTHWLCHVSSISYLNTRLEMYTLKKVKLMDVIFYSHNETSTPLHFYFCTYTKHKKKYKADNFTGMKAKMFIFIALLLKVFKQWNKSHCPTSNCLNAITDSIPAWGRHLCMYRYLFLAWMLLVSQKKLLVKSYWLLIIIDIYS